MQSNTSNDRMRILDKMVVASGRYSLGSVLWKRLHHRGTEITQRATELLFAMVFSVNLCVISVPLW